MPPLTRLRATRTVPQNEQEVRSRWRSFRKSGLPLLIRILKERVAEGFSTQTQSYSCGEVFLHLLAPLRFYDHSGFA